LSCLLGRRISALSVRQTPAPSPSKRSIAALWFYFLLLAHFFLGLGRSLNFEFLSDAESSSSTGEFCLFMENAFPSSRMTGSFPVFPLDREKALGQTNHNLRLASNLPSRTRRPSESRPSKVLSLQTHGGSGDALEPEVVPPISPPRPVPVAVLSRRLVPVYNYRFFN